MPLGSDAEALAYEENVLQVLLLRAEAAEELVEAQKYLVKARECESKAAKILVRKAIYEEDICRLRARSRLFRMRANECEKYYEEGNVDSFKKAADSRNMKSRHLASQAHMCEKKISIIEERANKILEEAEKHRKEREEHASEARRLEGDAVALQREF